MLQKGVDPFLVVEMLPYLAVEALYAFFPFKCLWISAQMHRRCPLHYYYRWFALFSCSICFHGGGGFIPPIAPIWGSGVIHFMFVCVCWTWAKIALFRYVLSPDPEKRGGKKVAARCASVGGSYSSR